MATAGGVVGALIAPAGASRGREAVDLRDGGPASPLRRAPAVANVTERIGPALVGLDVDDQAAVDARILGLDPDPALAGWAATPRWRRRWPAQPAAVSHGRPLGTAPGAGCRRYRPVGATLTPLRIPPPEIQIRGRRTRRDASTCRT